MKRETSLVRKTRLLFRNHTTRTAYSRQLQLCLHGIHYFAADTFSTSSGTVLNRSPTKPTSAIWKIGASGSLFNATIIFDSFIPARCWIAPEIPTAMYSSGATTCSFSTAYMHRLTFPVCPTWSELSA